MQWFTEVNDAINALQSANDDQILVVSVEGNAKSEHLKLIETLETSLKNTLNDSKFVGLHVPSSSILYQQLCAIYHMVPVPCLFFIRGDGQPIDIIDHVWSEEVNPRIVNVVKSATFSVKENLNDHRGISTSKQEAALTVKEKVLSFTTAQSTENNNPHGNADVKGDIMTNTMCQPRLPDGSGDVDPVEASLRSEGTEEACGSTSFGGNYDQELQSVIQSNTYSNVPENGLPDNWSLHGNQFEQPATSALGRSARVQFRLPSGESYTYEFPICTTVRELYNHVEENIKLPFCHWTLALVFPRRELDLENGGETLSDLALVPNGVVLIVPRAAEIAQESLFHGASNMVLSLFARPLAIVYSMWSYVYSYIFPEPELPENPETDSQELERLEQNSTQHFTIRRQARMPATSVTRDGNIHRLTFGRDDDDDSNTWNGNSTQQM